MGREKRIDSTIEEGEAVWRKKNRVARKGSKKKKQAKPEKRRKRRKKRGRSPPNQRAFIRDGGEELRPRLDRGKGSRKVGLSARVWSLFLEKSNRLRK